MAQDILPSSLSREQRGVIASPLGNLRPGFCANCGVRHGFVPVDDCNFLFVLCNDCADKWGPVAGTYMEPDAAFRQRVAEVQLEEQGRFLTEQELLVQLDDPTSTLAQLVSERQAGKI